MYSWEMNGGRERNISQMRNFRSAIKDCNLIDLGCTCNFFTFSNKRKGKDETKARLDIVFANKDWMKVFPNASVRNEFANTSDHSPLILTLVERRMRAIKSGPGVFRFEPMWLRDESSRGSLVGVQHKRKQDQ